MMDKQKTTTDLDTLDFYFLDSANTYRLNDKL